jgi:outer membrane protein TolC
VAATALEVQKTVTRTYYHLVGAGAVARAARRTLAAAEDNVRYIEVRVQAGLASDLDLKRAIAEVERDRQAIEDADFSIVTLGRSLETLSGVAPAGDLIADAPAVTQDDLRDELPLAEWTKGLDQLPSVRAAAFDQRAVEWTAAGARAALYPTVSAQFTERATNAFGFGQSPYYVFEVLGTLRLDRANVEAARVQRAEAETSAVRYDRARATAADTLFNDWHQVKTQLAKTRAARSSLDASRTALSVARERYGSGRATQLDVVQAERDAFAAEVTEIQAEADLASSRAVLRLSAGQSVVEAR